jgi:hypothetical protein
MSGGGKTQTATQQVQIPPEVMARYNAVNTRAETAAAQPFQAYSQDPSAFVAPLTATQQAGIQNINKAAGMTQPYFQTAAGLTMAGSQGVGPLTQQQIGYYQNPFTQSVVGSTLAGLQQQQGQQLAQQQAEAIKGGAFGGDRAGIQRAQLQGQQNLATAQAISPLMMQGYQQGVQTAMGQQNVLAQDLQRQLAAGQQLGGLGAQGQQAALAGAQAQLGAGTAEQQTEQAGKQALYNQFLQERGYPFQVAQFLANIAMGTGALSGSTTQTTQPAPFFSDEREKTNIQPLGDGLYAYDYTADVEAAEREGRPMPPKRVGPMAQDIEERAPGLVGDVNGHKVVDMNSMGGLVGHSGAYASGGAIAAPADMQAILAAIGQPLAFYGGKGGQGLGSGGVGAAGYIPQSQVAQPKLVTAGGLPAQGPSTFESALDKGAKVAGLYKAGKEMFGGSGKAAPPPGPSRAAPPAPKGSDTIAESMPQAEWDIKSLFSPGRYSGGLVRSHYAGGGALPYATGDMGEDPLQKIGEPDDQKHELMTPGKLGAPAPGLGSQLLDAGSKAASIASMAMMFSDARMKDNIEPVGELYDGQPIYRYNMKGSPKTQLGLMAQDLEHNGHGDAVAGLGGLKMVDYKRATDVAAGLAPRQGYQAGGSPANDGMSDEDYAIRTIAAEMSGGNPEEARAIAHVIENRRASGRWGDAYKGVVQSPRQFEPWSNPEAPNYPMRYASDSPRIQMAREALTAARGGEDVTGGALHFYAPAAQAQLARDRGDREPVPSWAKDREYTDFGPTRIVRGVDVGGARPAGVVRASSPTGVVPERVTPGVAGPGRGPMDPASAPFLTLARRAFGMEGEGTPTQKALTSENFVVPVLAGIGSMLSSRSPYLASAVGEGLVGGTGAYTALQKQQQEMGESRARTEAQMADISQKAFFEYAGRGMVRFLKPDGSYGTMGFADYFSLPRDKRPPVDPRFREYLESIEPTYRKQEPAAAAAPAAGGAAPSSTIPEPQPGRPVPSEAGATRPSGIPTAVELSPEDRTSAFELARRVSLEGRQSLEDRRKSDFFQPQRAAATASQGVIQATLPLTATILSLPRGQSLGTSGPFTQAIAPYVAAMNNLVEVATGRIGAVIDPEILASRESVEKEINKLRGQTTSEAGQRAVAALEEMAKSLVSLKNAPEGQRKILAKVLTDTQRNIDKDRWFSQWIEAGSTAPGGERGVFSDYARLTGQEANQEFDRRYGEAFFAEDRKNLETMMNKLIPGTRSAGGQPMTAFEYIAKNAAQLPANQILQFADEFGVNSLRYFGIDPARVQQLRREKESARG